MTRSRFLRTLTLALAIGAVLALWTSPARAHPGAGIIVSPSGVIYFVVFGRSTIMRIDPGGRAQVHVDDERLGLPHHLALDSAGNLYTISDSDRVLWRVSPSGALTRVRQLPVGLYGDPFAMGPDGTIYSVTDDARSRIVRVTPTGGVVPVAGGAEGYRDGPAADAQFGDLHFSALALGPDGSLVVTDRSRLRLIDAAGNVSTLAAGPDLAIGVGLARVGDTVYVADYEARRVVRVAGGRTTPVIGTDGLWAVGVTSTAGALYVLDTPPMASCVWRVEGNNADRLACVRDPSVAGILGFISIVGLLLGAIALRPPPRVTSWLLGLALGGLVALGGVIIAGNARVGFMRPLLLGLWVAALVLPGMDYVRAWRSRRRA